MMIIALGLILRGGFRLYRYVCKFDFVCCCFGVSILLCVVWGVVDYFDWFVFLLFSFCFCCFILNAVD